MPAHTDLQARLVPEDRRVQGDKRQEMPYILHWTCPSCGTQHERNYSNGDHYLSCPTFGADEEESLYCWQCDEAGRPCEFAIKLRVTLTLEIV